MHRPRQLIQLIITRIKPRQVLELANLARQLSNNIVAHFK